jgi:hypothetical protein
MAHPQQQQQQQHQHPAPAAVHAPATAAQPASGPSGAAPQQADNSAAAKPARKQRAMHSRSDAERHGLATPSDTDLVLVIDTPPGGRCDPLHRTILPSRSSNNDQARRWVIQLLSDKSALAIPAPHLSKILSLGSVHTFDDLDSLTNSAEAAQHLSEPERAYFHAASAMRSSDSEGDERGYLATSTLPADSCHTHWSDLLTPASSVMTATKSHSSNGHRLVLRLAFNNAVVCSIARLHLTNYIDLFEGHPAPALHARTATAWKTSTSTSGADRAKLEITPYVPRYETTAVAGWPVGPDGPPSSALFMDFTEPLGNLDALRSFIAARAPHCTRWHVQDRPADATATVQFYHERQYRTELFALDGATSPPHGILRPLRLHYKERAPPAVQCCSFCGEPGHSATACPLAAQRRQLPLDNSTMDTSPPTGSGPGVCRLCYCPAPHHACQTPPEQRHCKLCNKQGHTSFSCAQYRSHWVPLAKPSASVPANPRPLYLAASQRGVSWSSIVSRPSPAAAQQQAPAPALQLYSPAHFPPLPSAPAALSSPAPSTASPPHSPAPSSPHSPSSPAALDQQTLISIAAAVMVQLLPHLSSALSPMITAAVTAEVAKITAHTNAILEELLEERAARLKTPPFPLPRSQSWVPPTRPLCVYMADTQPSPQTDLQRGPARAVDPAPAPAPALPTLPQHQPIQQIIVGHNAGSLAWNTTPPPTASSAPPLSQPAAHPPTALQHAGLQAAQQQAPPPHYHQ